MTLACDARAFIAGSMVMQVATLSPRRQAFMTPLWFVDTGGTLYMALGTGTRAARNVTHHPGVTLLFRGEHTGTSTRVLRVRGTATCRPGMPPWPVLVRIAAKYYLAPQALAVELRNAGKWALRMRYYARIEGGAGHLVVLPTAAEFLPAPSARP
jgi:hypothetical protein